MQNVTPLNPAADDRPDDAPRRRRVLTADAYLRIPIPLPDRPEPATLIVPSRMTATEWAIMGSILEAFEPALVREGDDA